MNKKGAVLIGIPNRIRASLIFTLFFAIVGITIKSILANQPVIANFFVNDYLSWFKSFGAFVNTTQYASIQDLVFSILKEWYYFFYTGGLISLIWALLSWIIHLEIMFGKNKSVYKIKMEQEIEKTNKAKIDYLLLKGYGLLVDNELEKSIEVYKEIKEIYKPENDKNKEYYHKILDFHTKITKKIGS